MVLLRDGFVCGKIHVIGIKYVLFRIHSNDRDVILNDLCCGPKNNNTHLNSEAAIIIIIIK